MQLNARQPESETTSTEAVAAGTTWTDLVGFWTGHLRASTPSLAVFAEANRATEQALRISQTVFEANRKVADAVYAAAQHQQEQAFTAASSALATLAHLPGNAERQAATASLQQLAQTCTEACSRSRAAAWSLTGAMLGARSQPAV
jgi:hypothetical protein